MFIEFEETPNPLVLKFLPGRTVFAAGTREYKSSGEAVLSPLAARLFEIPGVAGVFLAGDFVSVTKDAAGAWADLKPAVLTALMDHFMSGLPAVTVTDEAAGGALPTSPVLGELERQIVELLDTRVKPAVAMDGGNIEFVSFSDGVVYLRMEGACAGCPSSTMTLKNGIETMLRHYVPEIDRVEAIAD